MMTREDVGDVDKIKSRNLLKKDTPVFPVHWSKWRCHPVNGTSEWFPNELSHPLTVLFMYLFMLFLGIFLMYLYILAQVAF